jgi:hypothetical protein
MKDFATVTKSQKRIFNRPYQWQKLRIMKYISTIYFTTINPNYKFEVTIITDTMKYKMQMDTTKHPTHHYAAQITRDPTLAADNVYIHHYELHGGYVSQCRSMLLVAAV